MKKNWRKFRQALDRAIYEGRGKQFAWLGGFLLLAFGVMLLFATLVHFDPRHPSPTALTHESASDSTFVSENPSKAIRVLELMLDPGSFVGGHKYGKWWLQMIIVLVGATLFTSFLIGAIANLLNRRIESLTKGQYTYDFEDHILIFGSSGMLMNILRQIGNTGHDIVIQTDRDVEQVREMILSYIGAQAMKNIYVVFGKRANPSALDSLHVAEAHSIYVIGEDDESQHDGLSLKCWHYITEKCKDATVIKDCYLLLDRLTSHNVFSYRQESCSTDKLRLNIVSAVENMAQGVLVSGEVKSLKYPALDRGGITKDSDINVHLILVGMTQVAYAMATTAAHICHFPNFRTKGKKTKITFVQKDIKQEVDFWRGHFDSLMDLSYSEYVSWDETGNKNVVCTSPKAEYLNPKLSGSDGFLDVEWEFIDAGIEEPNVREYIRECVRKDGVSEYLSFAFCGHEPEDNVAASLYLPKEVYAKNEIPVYVYQPLTRWVLATAKESNRYSNLYPFGMRTDCFDPRQERLLWAKRINFLYNHCYDYNGMGTLEELDDMWYMKSDQYIKQQSNEYAANSIPVKFRSVGLNPEERMSLTDDEVQILAETEHNRWNVERLLAGYSPVPYEKRKEFLERQRSASKADSDAAKDEKQKLKELFMHADIAPYDELLDSSKDYDINIVKNLLDVIRK
ncbi:MAG: hypothetical protein IKV05_00350 [Bacteroidales bacterium]|nr:hypothetical protein [Bacteroidales bacterium]